MAEKCIELDSVEIAAAVFGNCDRNIRLLEKEFSVTAVCRGTQLRISGEPANVAAANRAVEGMLLLIENRTPLEDQTVHYCISLAHDGAEKRVKELTEDFVTVTVKGRPIRPKTLGQKEYLSAIRSNAITFGVGPAGTGKTYLAVAMAVKAFKAKEVSRIILTRPAVEAGEKLGFLSDSDIYSLFGNLLDNAAKFAATGSVITIVITKKDGKACTTVRNLGATIPKDELPVLFDRFHKADYSRSMDREGVGLGLYIVKTILGNLKEDIHVTSEDGVTEFTFTLTLA